MNLLIKLLDEELYRGQTLGPPRPGDAGIDLRAREDVTVDVGESVAIPLGVAVSVPPDCVGWLTGRSSSQLEMGLFIHEGKIDSGYRGEIHCVCAAAGAGAVIVERGDKLCSLVVVRIEPPRWEVVTELNETERGEQRFGSTGIR